MSELLKIDKDYAKWIEEISHNFKKFQIKASASVNVEMLKFYWIVGKGIEELSQKTTKLPQVGAEFQKTTKSPQVGGEFDNMSNLPLSGAKSDAIVAFMIPWGHMKVILDKYKNDSDNQTIGILICKNKDNVLAKYVVETQNEPVAISEYELSKLFPKDFKSSMPTIEEREREN